MKPIVRLLAIRVILRLGIIGLAYTKISTACPGAPTMTYHFFGKKMQSERYHLDGPTRMDKRAADILSHAGGLSLPRKWARIPRWEDLVRKETERLQRECGSDALEDKRRRQKEKGCHAFLRHRYEAGGESVVELTRVAEDSLLSRIGSKCYRRVVRDDDGITREYLIKRIVRGSSILEVRLSWYGQAWPLIQGGRAKAQSALKLFQTRMRQPLLFEELEEERRRELDGALRFMEAIRNARTVMDAVLCAFGQDGKNPLLIPAWRLRNLLKCEQDPEGFKKIRGCLMALQEIRFSIRASGTAARPSIHTFAPFLSQVEYSARGSGAHTDGDFLLSINPFFIGCLRVFEIAHNRDKQDVLIYDWGKNLSKDERKVLKDGFLKGFSALAPYYDASKGFTDYQSNLRRWMESQITLNRDGAKRDRRAVVAKANESNANEPRLYGHDFCSLLPEGKSYIGALGYYSNDRHPEIGRTLFGSNSCRGGLLEVLGYVLPSGRANLRKAAVTNAALQDIKAVVEAAMAGVIAARQPTGKWLSWDEAVKIQEQESLNRLTWYFFLPPNWREKLAQDFEEHQAQRYERGEVDYLVKVTTDRLTAEPLRKRLHDTRRGRNLSLAAVGAIFGVPRQTLFKWESGSRSIPVGFAEIVNQWVRTGEHPSSDVLPSQEVRQNTASHQNTTNQIVRSEFESGCHPECHPLAREEKNDCHPLAREENASRHPLARAKG